MKERIIKCCTKGELYITETDKVEGLKIVLVNEKIIPIARYEFDKNKLINIKKIQYSSNRLRIIFVDIKATTDNIGESVPL